MLNDFWDTAPAAYKYAVFGGMGLTGLGVVLVILGAVSRTPALTFVALAVIGAGLVCHMFSLVLRGRAVRKQLKDGPARR